MIKHKWGKNGPSYLFCEHGDLSFLLYLPKQCMVGNIQIKFQKKKKLRIKKKGSTPFDCLTCMLEYIAMQMREVKCKKDLHYS